LFEVLLRGRLLGECGIAGDLGECRSLLLGRGGFKEMENFD